MLDRLPIRLRLTLAFAGVMALVLAGAGALIRSTVARDLDSSLLASLRARAADVRALVDESGAGLAASGVSPLTEGGATFAQVLGPSGRVVDATPLLRDRPLLTPAQVAVAARRPVVVDRESVPGLQERARLLAVPEGDVPGRVVVVGTGLEARDDAVRNLGIVLAVGGPVALLIASLAGYGVASAALRPVEDMRRRADRISGAGRGERLPLAPADDEIRRLGETLNAMLARVERAVAHEKAFVADASHELRTPLTILKTELELALRHERTAEELRDAIASAGEETDRLVRLSEDLLVIARSDEGDLPLRRTTQPVAELLEAVAGRYAQRAAALGRELTVAPDGAGAVPADRERLEQAVANLVENALRHGTGPVRAWARGAGDAVEIHVSDAGPGMPEDFAPEAFERFSRADPARGRGGAGLGLAIVRAVARAHGGEAHVANRDGGFDAWITLPRGPVA